MRKRVKCIKCGLWFRDREDPKEEGMVYEKLCWNCRFVWQMIGYTLQALPYKINRDVRIHLEDVVIKKKK